MDKIKGFTVIELIVVIILISILTAFAITLVPDGTANLDGQAQQIASDIRLAQSLSQQRGQRFRINFSANNYFISDITGAIPYVPPAQSSGTVNLINGVTMNASLPFVVFDSQGVPYLDALIPGTALAAAMTITLTAPDGTSKVITLSPETGKVTA